MQAILAPTAPSAAQAATLRQAGRQQRVQHRAPLVVRASSDASGSGLSSGLSTSISLGPKAPGLGGSPSLGPSLGAKLGSSKPQVSLDDVPLKSGVRSCAATGGEGGRAAQRAG